MSKYAPYGLDMRKSGRYCSNMSRRTVNAAVAASVESSARRAGLAEATLALAADIDSSALADRLSGVEEFTVSELVRIGIATDVAPADLLRGAA